MTEILHRTIDIPNNDIEDAERFLHGIEDECLQIAMDNRGYRNLEVNVVVRPVESSEELEISRQIPLPNDDIENAKNAVEGIESDCVQIAMNNFVDHGHQELEVEIIVQSVSLSDDAGDTR